MIYTHKTHLSITIIELKCNNLQAIVGKWDVPNERKLIYNYNLIQLHLKGNNASDGKLTVFIDLVKLMLIPVNEQFS